MLHLIAAIVIVVSVHLLGMALASQALGIRVLFIRFGLGPLLFDGGLLQLGLIPLGGYVKLASRERLSAGAAPHETLEAQPRWKRMLVPLSGPAVLLALATAFSGRRALHDFASGFGQLIGGAADPLGRAPALLDALAAFVASHGLAATVALVACKVAAMHLLPYLGSNSVQAATSLVPERVAESKPLMVSLLLVAVALNGGWLVALFCWHGR